MCQLKIVMGVYICSIAYIIKILSLVMGKCPMEYFVVKYMMLLMFCGNS